MSLTVLRESCYSPMGAEAGVIISQSIARSRERSAGLSLPFICASVDSVACLLPFGKLVYAPSTTPRIRNWRNLCIWHDLQRFSPGDPLMVSFFDYSPQSHAAIPDHDMPHRSPVSSISLIGSERVPAGSPAPVEWHTQCTRILV